MTVKSSRPEILLALAAAVWGLFWIPLRAFEKLGVGPAWLTLSQLLTPLIILAPFALIRFLTRRPTGLNQCITGLLVGAGFTLYCGSLLLTDVVRALIFFYVMPAWGTIAEVGFMGRRFTFWRGLALILSMAGLVSILGIGTRFDVSFNLGDAMALLSGIVFTVGAMRVRQSLNVDVFEQVFAFFFYGTIAAVSLGLFPFTEFGALPDGAALEKFVPLMMLMAVVFLIPVMWGIYWGSRHVDPGRLGILLQLEAIVGIGSAALLANEVFGWKEAVGAVLVVSAGLVEVIGNNPDSEARAA